MDKCTTEQFWAVATLSGLDAVLLTQSDVVASTFAAALVVVAVVVFTLYGVYFVVDRHRAYYRLWGCLVDYLADKEAPEFFHVKHSPWKGSSLTGVVFFAGWIALLGTATAVVYAQAA